MAYIRKSAWLIHYDGSSCNGCDIEVLACLMPLYDVERFGIINTGDPKHADVFLVTGGVNVQNLPVVRRFMNRCRNRRSWWRWEPVPVQAAFSKTVTT